MRAVKCVFAFFWPFIAYRDAERGNLIERAAAWRYNRQLANSLPIYINRWAISVAIALILLYTVPAVLAPLIALLLTISVCGLLHLVRMWLLFRQRPF